MESVTVGFIGYGEVAHGFALGFKQFAVRTIAFDPQDRAKIMERAVDSNVGLVDSLADLVKNSTVIFSCVWPGAALKVAAEAAHFLTPDQAYIDINNISPQTTIEIEKTINFAGADFIKIAILSPVAEMGIKVPMLAGGQKAAFWVQKLNELGLDIKVIGDAPEKPAAIKILRSILLKGIIGLSYEMLMGAQKYGVEGEILELASGAFDNDSFHNIVDRWMTSTLTHAARRSEEMAEAAQTLQLLNISPAMTLACKGVFDQIADKSKKLNNPKPQNYIEVLNFLKES